MRIRACLLALLLPGVADLRGDTVELTTGGTLRGIDLKKKGQGYVFTLESGDVVYLKAELVRKMTRTGGREKVEFRGKQVSLRQKIRAVRAERRAEKKKVLRQIEQWAGGDGKKAEAARAAVLALPKQDKEMYFDAALRESRRPEARLLAAGELSRHATPRAMGSLVHAAVRDRYRSVRDASLQSLQIQLASAQMEPLADSLPVVSSGVTTAAGRSVAERSLPSTRDVNASLAKQFAPYLKSASRSDRTHAANALAVFPSRHAMPDLIRTLRMSWSGFGRAAVFQGTQRAYIGDYELVSGGTGFAIIEVADPVIRTVQTGVVLDVKVVRAELIARLRAMHKISGQEFGTDVRRWQRWWNQDGR